MKRYQCHKQVDAGKITEIDFFPESAVIHLEDGDSVEVDRAFILKHDPQLHGYLVRYDDGYLSWSPAQPFEEGYSAL